MTKSTAPRGTSVTFSTKALALAGIVRHTVDAEGTKVRVSLALKKGGPNEPVRPSKLYSERVSNKRQGSTALGFGVAIPHVFHPALRRIHVVVARSGKGISFGAVDGQSTSIFICVAGPESERDAYLKLLGRLARTLRDRDWRKFIQQAASADAIFDLLVEASPD